MSSVESTGYHDGKKTNRKQNAKKICCIFFILAFWLEQIIIVFFVDAYDTDYGDCSIGQPLC